MQIIRTNLFRQQLKNILFYIAKDKLSASKIFMLQLDMQIQNLVNFPYKFRQSYYYNDENIRDMVFKGYSIIYRIKQEDKVIEILEIFNKNLPHLIG